MPHKANRVGVASAATVEPKGPHVPQMPIAVPASRGSTEPSMRMGPHTVIAVMAMPSTARDANRTEVSCEKAPITEPMTIIATATTLIVRAPKRCARIPKGMAENTIINTKMVMSHEPAVASVCRSVISTGSIVGILYCTMAIATATSVTNTPTTAAF